MFWQQDIPSPLGLKNEIKRWQDHWLKTTVSAPTNLKDCSDFADPDFYPNIRQLLLVGCTLPIGSCEAERSFSVLKRLKSAVRSTMTTDRLSGLAVMAVHNETAYFLKTEEVVRRFVQAFPRKMFCQSILFE